MHLVFGPMQTPTIIDIEASGFGVGSYPIEVGYVDETGAGWCSLIKPEVDWCHWDQDAARIHHISRDLLLTHGKTCEYVADQLNQFLRDSVVYTDGWAFDYIWMARLFDAADRNQHFRLEDLRWVLTPEQERNWHATKSAVEKELATERHRASIDARILQQTWLRSAG